jgi:hypothetical protein
MTKESREVVLLCSSQEAGADCDVINCGDFEIFQSGRTPSNTDVNVGYSRDEWEEEEWDECMEEQMQRNSP